ncbi:PREDICTED: zinc carboxypeptidase A 1-like [Bactrocera latifrons]|uniref:zinc carboxypeptidase A 1-like n=1 Tax=Bactrocera latifrons TaxID=174628 RepID=UPI0008DE9210|nr:PREDICTED: zinc carboxypeptidase A 1-like [Bactrocera latifrons]
MWQQLGLIVLLGLAAVDNFATAERVRYDNYHVYQLQPKTTAQLDAVKELDGTSDALLFLDAVHYVNNKINVLVAPERVTDLLAVLQRAEVPHQLVEENAQKSLDLEQELVADPNRRTGDYTWREYHELDDTYAWLRTLTEKYPEQVSLFVAGKSYEGREILGVKISFSSSRAEEAARATKPGIFIEGGMHAREWISPATTTYIINQLLTSTNADVRKVAESYVWYFVPHSNPDGYVYTHTTNRLWRKTRTPYNYCYGADPNRNWDFHWNEVGSSNNPCSDTYAGPKAFSEIETRTLAEYISTLKGQLFLYLSFHSYSQLLLFPYGYTGELPPNYKDLKRVFDVAVSAVSKRYGTRYTGGNVYDAIYPAAGASLDWAYGKMNVPYSYCFELRPSSNALWSGFRLPAAQIIPTGEEIMDSMLAMINEIDTSSKM